MAGARERWRLDLGVAPATVPLGGWIVPSWAAELSITPQPGAAAAHHIAPARSVTGLAIDPGAFLRAAAQPAVEFARPKAMKHLAAGVERLLTELEKLDASQAEATGRPSE